MEQKPNARFWIRWHGGWVKLTLHPGQYVAMQCGGPTEEGWYSRCQEYRYQDGHILRTLSSDGRDCDGRIRSVADDEVPVSMLPDKLGRELETGWYGDRPKAAIPWVERGSSQRDEYAEKAGY